MMKCAIVINRPAVRGEGGVEEEEKRRKGS
jgi:hypothetical protein